MGRVLPVKDNTIIVNGTKNIYGSYLGGTTTFNSDGSITTLYSDGTLLIITFNSDGSITEKFSGSNVNQTRTTSFGTDGTINQVIS
jgi:hypothetical protein